MLQQITFTIYPSVKLQLENGTTYHADMNNHNREKLDLMESFPVIDIDGDHATLTADGITAYVTIDEI